MIYHIGTNTNPKPLDDPRADRKIFFRGHSFTLAQVSDPSDKRWRGRAKPKWTMCGKKIEDLRVTTEWFYSIFTFMAFKSTPEDICPACNLKVLGEIEL